MKILNTEKFTVNLFAKLKKISIMLFQVQITVQTIQLLLQYPVQIVSNVTQLFWFNFNMR